MNRTLLHWLCTLALVSMLAGCTTLDKSAAGLVITVDKAMRVWAAYLVSARADSTVDQAELARHEGRVIMAYESYQRSMMLYDSLRGTKDLSTLTLTLDQAQQAGDDLARLVTDLIRAKPVLALEAP